MPDQTLPRLVGDLIRSYSLQTELYRELGECIQKMYSRLILSRGDVSQVIGMFQEKQRLLNAITAERSRIEPQVQAWQRQKAAAAPEEAGRLDAALAGTENAIASFLDIERQVEHYLTCLVEREGGMSQ